MFSFFKKKSSHISGESFLPVQTDMHSHILPGIDDGSPDIETSLQLVRGLVELGVKKAIATPHIIGDLYRNTPETINDALTILKGACANEQIDIELAAAAEYMLDSHFLDLLRSKKPLLTIHKNIILTEQSYAVPTSNLNEMVFEIITEGYKPIMAHPERYFFYHDNYDKYFQLKDHGFLLQVNLLSLTGYYGKPVAKAAKFLFKEKLVDLVGTDMHHDRHLAALQYEKNIDLFHEYLSGRSYNQFTI